MYLPSKERYILAGIIAACVVVLLIVGVMLFGYHSQYKAASDEYQDLADSYAPAATRKVELLPQSTRTVQQPYTEEVEEIESVDFFSLVKVNPDVVGWITMPSCNINYPIVQANDNAYYLTRTYKGTENSAGAIFMDYENDRDFSDMHTILYGHNMKDGSMFGGLKKIRQNPSMINDAPYVYIYTPDGKIRQYRIFSSRIVPADSTAYRFFTGSYYYDEFVNECLSQARGHMDQNIDFSDRLPIITLSTCSGEDDRFLVHCVLTNIF